MKGFNGRKSIKQELYTYTNVLLITLLSKTKPTVTMVRSIE